MQKMKNALFFRFLFSPRLFCARVRRFSEFSFRPTSLGLYVGVPSFVRKKKTGQKKKEANSAKFIKTHFSVITLEDYILIVS